MLFIIAYTIETRHAPASILALLHKSNQYRARRAAGASDVPDIAATLLRCRHTAIGRIPKTGSTYHIVTTPEEDRAMAITRNMHIKLGEFERLTSEICVRTDRQTDRLITILRSPLHCYDYS